MIRPAPPGIFLALAVAAAGCFSEIPPEDDAGSPKVDVAEDLVTEDVPPLLVDRPAPPDAGHADAPVTADAPAPVDLGPRCASSSECTGGSLCGPDGRCGPCSPTDDRCPAAQHCDPTAAVCVPGCRSDEGCMPSMRPDGGTAPGRCDVARHVCTDCESDDDCPVRSVCRMGVCTPGCNERRGCGGGEVCCEGTCVDVQADIGNCGACGRRCSVSNGVARCAAGVCGLEACTAGFADCNSTLTDGCEANLQSDPTRCGSCGVSCPTPPGAGSVACASGRCGFVCAEGTADCDGDSRNGCERTVARDASHCGRCNNACPARANASMPRCDMGACGFNCNAGFGNCDGDAANGCEANTRTSVDHCGACGRACPAPANATATCAAGACGYTCNAGFGDCDGDAANGCEADTRTSVQHCGRCGALCTIAGGTAACADGTCGIATCGGAFVDCDGNVANGCETDTRNSPAHCGACGRACPSAPNTTASCAAGTCGSRCATGFGDCDGSAANGCEVDLRTSLASCGRCGVACSVAGGTSVCAAGVCGVGSCASGRGNCDGNAANGCEVDLTSNPMHCGACGAGSTEVCDGRDNSCDRVVDNGCPTGLGGLTTFDYTSPEHGTGTMAVMNANCPNGQVARGVFGTTSGIVVTSLSVICGTPSLAEDRSVTPYRYNVTLSGATDVGVVGNPAFGSPVPFRFQCPGHSVITRVNGMTGPYIYQFAVTCSTLSVTGSPGALRVTATAPSSSPNFGGGGSGTAFTYACPANASGSVSALRSLFGRQTAIFGSLILMSSIGARCSVPSVTVR